jgi:5-methylcytosine-specific restriction endonuclease McrA
MTKRNGSRYGYRHVKLRKAALERDGYRCVYCGKPADTVDHLIEVARGGTDTLDNYVAACKRCNSRRGAIFGNKLRALERRHPFFP